MADPYRVLGVSRDADDSTVRNAYVALLRRFPPEREPESFQRIQCAYEKIRDARARLHFLVFEPSQGESCKEWIQEVRCEMVNSRLSLERIRKLFRPS